MNNSSRLETDSLSPENSKIIASSNTSSLELDFESMPSPTLDRLIKEVRNLSCVGRSYDRVHHRHNR